ncbi:hypothetical protein [Propioniciclava flava]
MRRRSAHRSSRGFRLVPGMVLLACALGLAAFVAESAPISSMLLGGAGLLGFGLTATAALREFLTRRSGT